MTRLLHISDVHLPIARGAIPARLLLHPKRLLGWLNHRVRRGASFAEAPRRLELLTGFARARRPRAILFSGDISSIGTEAELVACRRALQPMAASASHFICLPGNHDIYVGRGAWRRHFADLSPASRATEEDWPLEIKLAEDLTLFVLDSTRSTNLPLSCGMVPAPVLDRLASRLDSCPGYRLLAMHHGPWRADGKPDLPSHGLINRRRLLGILANRPRMSLLHGHLHQGFHLPRGNYPAVFCAGSATHRHLAGGWEFTFGPGRAEGRRVRLRDCGYGLAEETILLD